VRDAAALLDAMAVPDPHAMYQAPVPAGPFVQEVGRSCGRSRIGLLTSPPRACPSTRVCVAAAEHTARLLEALGHTVYPVTPTFFSEPAIAGYTQVILDVSLWAARRAAHPDDGRPAAARGHGLGHAHADGLKLRASDYDPAVLPLRLPLNHLHRRRVL
jgi:Asp-tRNA(Asn)/Glu-tRNA(Gln) amidotransferase A subunit family amidase